MLEVRHAIPDDAEAITEVAVTVIREVCGPSGHYTPEQIAEWADEQHPNEVLKWMADEDRRLYSAVLDERVVGFALMDLAGEIEALAVDPACQRRGLGAALLAEVVNEAEFWERERLTVVAPVLAAPFYARMGFRELGATGRARPSVRMEKDL